MARVSALIPTYNREEYVGGAIQTVLAQTYQDIEAVVVNDGSTDDTRDVLAEYAENDRVQIYHNDQNRGISYSFNRAAAEARGELLCILGDDDRWHPEKTRKQVRRMDGLDGTYGVVYTGGVVTKSGDIINVDRPNREGDLYPEIIGSWGLTPHSSHMIRREAFESVGGFDTDFSRGVDREMCIRLARDYQFDYLPELLVERMIHGGNISHEPEQAKVESMIGEKYMEEIRENPAVQQLLKGRRNQMQSRIARDRGDRQAAMRHAWIALKQQPTVYRALQLLLPLVGLLGPDVGSQGIDSARTLRRQLLDAKLRATTDQFWTWTHNPHR